MSVCWDEGRGEDVGDFGVVCSERGDDWASCSKRPTRLETRFLGVSVRAIVDGGGIDWRLGDRGYTVEIY